MRGAAIEAGFVQSAHAGDIRWRERLRIITYVRCLSPFPLLMATFFGIVR